MSYKSIAVLVACKKETEQIVLAKFRDVCKVYHDELLDHDALIEDLCEVGDKALYVILGDGLSTVDRVGLITAHMANTATMPEVRGNMVLLEEALDKTFYIKLVEEELS